MDYQSPLDKSILVLKNIHENMTFTVVGQAKIPGSDYVFKGSFRNHILIGDDKNTFRVDYVPRPKQKESPPESLPVDELDANAIIAKTNLAWEKLEARAESLGLDMLKSYKEKKLPTRDCDSSCETEEELSNYDEDTHDYERSENEAQ